MIRTVRGCGYAEMTTLFNPVDRPARDLLHVRVEPVGPVRTSGRGAQAPSRHCAHITANPASPLKALDRVTVVTTGASTVERRSTRFTNSGGTLQGPPCEPPPKRSSEYDSRMGKQEDFVLRSLEERDVRFVRLWFTDVLGFLKSVAVAPAELEGAFDEGIGFDGSAIE